MRPSETVPQRQPAEKPFAGDSRKRACGPPQAAGLRRRRRRARDPRGVGRRRRLKRAAAPAALRDERHAVGAYLETLPFAPLLGLCSAPSAARASASRRPRGVAQARARRACVQGSHAGRGPAIGAEQGEHRLPARLPPHVNPTAARGAGNAGAPPPRVARSQRAHRNSRSTTHPRRVR